MNNRKAKKIFKEGTLFTVVGTHIVGMSLGYKGNSEIDSFNLIDIIKQEPVKRCDGKCRLTTRKEQSLYWHALKILLEKH